MPGEIYHFNRSNRAKHRRRYRRRSSLLAIVFIIFAIAVVVVIYDIYRLNRATSKPIGVTYQQTIAGPQTFRSSYFQFSDTAKWVYAPNDSTSTKLTYLLYAAGLPVHSLTVYVNQTPLQSDLAVTRVLPVQVKNGNAFTLAGDISAPCSSLYSATDLKRIKTVSLSGTSFLCVPDSPQFSAVVGQVGADYNLNLKRGDGETANYIVIYHNLSIDPDPAPFVRIMKTFQAL
jgi:hypothetical protein